MKGKQQVIILQAPKECANSKHISEPYSDDNPGNTAAVDKDAMQFQFVKATSIKPSLHNDVRHGTTVNFQPGAVSLWYKSSVIHSVLLRNWMAFLFATLK